jgi:haloalkane dehalogenase
MSWECRRIQVDAGGPWNRLIAPDPIGMGDSDKLLNPGPTTYTFSTHRDHLWVFIDAVVGSVDKVVLVINDWGSALGFDSSRARLRNRIHGRPCTSLHRLG